MVEDKVKIGIAAALAGATAALAATALISYLRGDKGSASTPTASVASAISIGSDEELMAVIGDVGGTNVRLTLRKLNLRTRTSTEVK